MALLIELTPQEATALLRIADGGMEDLSEHDLNRLQNHHLIEQRGISFGLTATGMQTVARLRSH